MKVKVHSLDVATDFFDIVAGVLQKDMLAPYLLIICLDYVLWTSIDLMKENGFTLAKARSRWYKVWTIADTDYDDNIVLLANTPTKAESLLHSLEKAAGGIDSMTKWKTGALIKTKRRHLHTKTLITETSGQVHIPWKQHLICWKQHQYTISKGIDSYQ